MAKVTVRAEKGRLVVDFTYRGMRCREQTALIDSPVNRKRVQATLVKVTAAISARTFVYREFFPGSRRAERFDRDASNLAPAQAPSTPALPVTGPAAAAYAAASATPNFKDFTATGLSEHQIEWRRSHLKVLKCTLDGHLLPHFGDRSVGTMTKADILRSGLTGELGAAVGRARVAAMRAARMAPSIPPPHDAQPHAPSPLQGSGPSPRQARLRQDQGRHRGG